MLLYKKVILRLSLIFCISIIHGAKTLNWQHSLKLPSELTHGVLSNGMHYYLYPQDKPKNSISLRLLVNAGAAMEDDTLDGIAHFIEHMTFNGTKNFAPGT